MKRKLAAAVSIVLAFGVSACGQSIDSTPSSEPIESSSNERTTSVTTTTQASSSTTEETMISESVLPVTTPEEPVAQEATYTPPTSSAIDQQVSIWTEPGVGYQCAATDAWTSDPTNCTAANLGGDASYDDLWGPGAAIPAEEVYADVWMHDDGPAPYYEGCAAAICGYGYNDQGQRNPSSGEIQALDGCQQGYITDPELCEAVAWVETHEY